MKNEKNATKSTALENSSKSWLDERENEYLLHRLEVTMDGWSLWTTEEQIKDFCADMGVTEEADCMPLAVGTIVRAGSHALWYTDQNGNDYVEALPKELSAKNNTLRTILYENGAWNGADRYAVELAKNTSAKWNAKYNNTVLTVNADAADELIEQGLWRGDEVRMRCARLKGKSAKWGYTIWYADGTVAEWQNNTCVSDLRELQAEVIERLYGMHDQQHA